jgi:hypothetical protein
MLVVHLALPLSSTLNVSPRIVFLSSIALFARSPKYSRPLVQTSQLRGSLTSITIFGHEGRVNNPHYTHSTRYLPKRNGEGVVQTSTDSLSTSA